MNLEDTVDEKIDELRKAGFSDEEILLLVLKAVLKKLKVRVRV